MTFSFNIRGAWKAVVAVGVGVVATVLAPASAQAALIFQSEQPIYSVAADGTQQATVRIFLVETAGEVSTRGNLNSYGLAVRPVNPPANPVRINSIVNNPAFTDTFQEITDVTNGVSTDAISSATGGISPEAVSPTSNRYFLTTFTFSGLTAGGQPAATTTFSIGRRGPNAGDTFTGNGTELDSQIQPGQFVISVTPIPEPTAVAFAGLLGVGLLARRRRSA